MESTKKLIRKAQEGDRTAFELLVKRYESRIEALVRSRLGVHLEQNLTVQDLLQDVLLQACRSLSSFQWQGEDSFMRWLGGIAENLVRKECRRRERTRQLRLPLQSVEQVSPSKAMRREERFDRLKSALAQLSSDHREVILLSRIEGLSVKEIARKMGRSEVAIKSLLARAIRELRATFGNTESLRLPRRSLSTGEVDNEQ